ncbi:MAG: SufE family protein [Pirellulaceae bacterium]|nr:SufE family protein [Pirellulaceae bacterium]
MNDLSSLDEILETFGYLDEWEERYRYLIELGTELAPLPQEVKTDEYKVEGCLSNVWLLCRYADKEGKLYLEAESDAAIVQGLVAVLMATYNGQSPEYILDFDFENLFHKLGFGQNLSRSRSNGLRAMISHIHQFAERYRQK